MFTFVRFMWYDPQEQRKCARVRRTFCNVTMLPQILPKTQCKNQVSEPGNVFTTFSMSRGDVGLTFDQPHSFPAVYSDLIQSHSHHCVLQAEDCVFVRRCISPYRCICLVPSRRVSKSLTTWAPILLNRLKMWEPITNLGVDFNASDSVRIVLLVQSKRCPMLYLQSSINFICSRPSWWLVLRSATSRYELGGGVYWEVVAASFVVQSMYFESWLCFVPMQKVTSLDDRRKVFLISFWCFFGSWNLLCPKAKATKVMTIPRLTLLILETHGSHYLNLPSTKITSACVEG